MVSTRDRYRRSFALLEGAPKPLVIDASLESEEILSSISLSETDNLRHDCDMYAVSVNLNASGELILVPSHDRSLSINPRISPWRLTHNHQPAHRHGVLFRELISLRPKASFQIDVAGTSPQILPTLASLISSASLEERVCIGSRFDVVADTLANAFPFAPVFFPRIALARLSLAAILYQSLEMHQPYTVLNLPMTFEGLELINSDFVDSVQNHGMWLNVRKPDDPQQLAKLLELNVDGIIFDTREAHAHALLDTRKTTPVLPTPLLKTS